MNKADQLHGHRRRGARSALAEGLQHTPDEGDRGREQRDGTSVQQHFARLQGFVAKEIGSSASYSCNKILPKMVTRFTLAALQEQHDQAGKCHYSQPIVGRFHSIHSFAPPYIARYDVCTMLFAQFEKFRGGMPGAASVRLT
jgi:hypothetical protein